MTSPGASTRRTPIQQVRPASGEPPSAPADWRLRAVLLLQRPELAPQDAQAIRLWIGWRKLPPTYWQRLLEIERRSSKPNLADDFGTGGMHAP